MDTGLPDSDATVTIDGTDGNYTLNFTIPQGPTGPEAVGLTAFGGLESATDTLNLTQNTPSSIGLDTELPALNVTYDTASNNLTLNEPGIYEINYKTTLNLTTGGNVTLAVTDDGTPIANSSVSANVTASTPTTLSGQVLANIEETSVLQLTLTATDTADTGNATNTEIIVKKLN